MPRGELLKHNGQAARLMTWSGRRRRAVLAPVLRKGVLPSSEFVHWCCSLLSNRGYSQIYSPALTEHESAPYLETGFDQCDALWLLTRPLGKGAPGIPSRSSDARITRARRRHLPAVESIDAASFDDFWCLDRQGLLDARAATPSSRFTVAIERAPLGYAITGWGSGQAYLQRLAVAPGSRRRGVARDLVADALRAARHRFSAHMLVNTPVGNEAALALYTSLGFVLQEGKLVVLRKQLRATNSVGPECTPKLPGNAA